MAGLTAIQLIIYDRPVRFNAESASRILVQERAVPSGRICHNTVLNDDISRARAPLRIFDRGIIIAGRFQRHDIAYAELFKLIMKI